MDLKGRVAIVTGASRGIGRRIAIDLAAAGADVVVAAKTDRPHPKLPGTIHETAAEIERRGARALPVKVDVREAEALEDLVRRTLDAFGRVDIVINNAGALWWQPVLDTPARRFDLMIGVNVRAAFLLSRAAAAAMIDAGHGGHIVMMSPPLDTRPHPGVVGYTISKFGMTMAAIGMAEEFRSHRIAVNSLWPATMIESQATIGWGLGDRRQWRRPEIVSDATLALVRRDPAEVTGRQLIDEDFLRECGVTDFSRYRCDPDHEPPRIPFSALSETVWRRARKDRT
ncbi:MAG: SDR family NAD(P)-dependent oxidoreductase [Acidobacteria bacterium]|nr:MAG: SDR family NAD(P)-dependent oxidoreductase [Acidobacteriota bacterium]